ncbi:MAG: CHAT domain-containing protein [Bacteroidia bacterium]
MDSLTGIKNFYRQARLAALSQEVSKIPVYSPLYPEALIYKIRTLIEFGLAGQAVKELETAIPDVQNPEFLMPMLCMAKYLRALHTDTEGNIRVLISWIDKTLQTIDNKTVALYLRDFQMKARGVRHALGRMTRAQWISYLNENETIARDLFNSGQWEESWIALRRGAMICIKRPFQDHPRAIHWLSQIKEEAKAKGDDLFVGEAILAMGEVAFHQHWNKQPIEKEPQEYFREAADYFIRAGHAFPEEKSLAVLGEYLLQHGVAEGVQILEQCMPGLEQAGDFRIRQSAWSAMNLWFTKNGNPEAAAHALQESRKLNEAMNLGIGLQVSVLGEAEAFFRQGKTKQAITALDSVIRREETTMLSVSAVQMKSNMLAQAGSHAEAIQTLLRLLPDLEEEGETPFLAHYYYHLFISSSQNPQLAIRWLSKAVSIYENMGDTLSAGQAYAQRAFTYVQTYLQKGMTETGTIPPEITADFEAARNLLLLRQDMETMEQMGNLCNYWGQAGMVFKDYKACGKWLSEAENIYRTFSRKTELAFTLVYQGLVLIEIGRKGNYSLFDIAGEKFAEAADSFRSAGLEGVLWQARFHQGLAKYEYGCKATPKDPQSSYFEDAAAIFEDAAEKVDALRNFAGSDETLSGQMAGMNFMKDKQVLMRTGFNNAFFYRNRNDEAIFWLERMKGQAMLDALFRQFGPEDTPLSMAVSAQKTDRNPTKVIRWEEVKEILRTENNKTSTQTLIVTYFCSPDHIIAFGFREDWDTPRSAFIQLDYTQLRRSKELFGNQVKELYRSQSRSLEWDTKYLPSPDEQWAQIAPVIEPVSRWSQPGDTVCLVPHSLLHDLPLHALPIEDMALIERNPVVYLPSLSLLPFVKSSLAAMDLHSAKTIFFGNPTLDLPGAESECSSLADQYGGSLFLGKSVNRQKILQGFRDFDMVHYAGHAKFSPENGWNSGLNLSGAEQLQTKDFFGQPLRTKIAVLSGCETALSTDSEGDERVGLVRVLLLSGVKKLIVSQWPVHDKLTSQLLTDFYRRLFSPENPPVAVALQQAIISLKNNHPDMPGMFHWAPFVLTGSWI